MKGLLLKDAYMAWKYCRAFLLIVGIFLAVLYVDETDFFFAAYPAIFVGMIPVQLMFYEEKCKWDLYSMTLPVSRGKIVSCKYLLTLICAATLAVVTGIVRVIFSFMNSTDLHQVLPYSLVPVVIILFAASLELPLLFKMGAEKGRIIYNVINTLVCVGIVLVQFSDNVVIRAMVTGNRISPDALFDEGALLLSAGGVLFLLLISAILFAFSWFLSIRFYSKREL